jgi:hypothetical protein
MAGYMARTGPATGVRDELSISALVLKHADRRLAIVTADVAGVNAELIDEIASAVGWDRADLVVCASHTHSGPAGVTPRLHPADDDRLDPPLRAEFIAICASVIDDADKRCQPVELLFGSSETLGLAANRNDADGPYDPRLSVLAARSRSGEMRAVLVNLACHPTILGADSRLISAEFPGALRRCLSDALRVDQPPPDVLFANAAAGDVSTRYTRRSQDGAEVERVGAGFAAAAIEALRNARPVDGTLAHARRQVTLTPRSLTELAETRLEAGVVSGEDAERRKAETRSQGAVLLERLAAAGPGAIRTEFDLEAWAIGDIALVAVPGELFASLGETITTVSDRPTLVLGYANGYVGYLVDEASIAAGTYEALASPFADGSGELVAQAGRELAQHVRMVSPGESGDR